MTKMLTFLMSLSMAGEDKDEEGEGREGVTSSLVDPPSSASPSATVVVGVSEASEVEGNLKEREREVAGEREGERVGLGHGGEGRGKEVNVGTTRVCILCFASFHPKEEATHVEVEHISFR